MLPLENPHMLAWRKKREFGDGLEVSRKNVMVAGINKSRIGPC
jgi:hypothetical protein